MIDIEFLWQQLKTVEDPDVHVNIVDLGLVYNIETKDEAIHIVMTLTSPSCPMGDFLMDSVRQMTSTIYPDKEVAIELIWDPPWNQDMISEVGKMELGLL